MVVAFEFPPTERRTDVCIVGAGPAGIALALQCETRGLSVCLVDAGGYKPKRVEPALTNIDILDEEHHAPLAHAVRQAFGGTSWAWGGGCVPFDPIDFEQREYVPHSGWPISYKEIAGWYGAAAQVLGCGSADFSLPGPDWALDGIEVNHIERISTQTNLAKLYRRHVETSSNIWACLKTSVVGFELDPTGTRAVALKTAGNPGFVPRSEATVYVLACGGVRTTHCLLNLQTEWPQHFGGVGGPLGRYYMGHIVGEIATLIFNNEVDASSFLFNGTVGSSYLRQFRIGDGIQQRLGLLNTHFTLRVPPLEDHRHENGALSLLLLLAMIPSLRENVQSDRFRKAFRDRSTVEWRDHLTNILRKPGSTAAEIFQHIQRKTRSVIKAPFLSYNRGGRYSLHYHAEQTPNPESRMRLLHSTEQPYSLPRLLIDYRVTKQDAHSVIRAHEILDATLRKSGIGHLEYWHEPTDRLAAVMALASDGYHQVGTTRMGLNANGAIVDRNARIHGLTNVFIASSSVFPTTGRANPTLHIVALAARLAHHLSQELSKRIIVKSGHGYPNSKK